MSDYNDLRKSIARTIAEVEQLRAMPNPEGRTIYVADAVVIVKADRMTALLDELDAALADAERLRRIEGELMEVDWVQDDDRRTLWTVWPKFGEPVRDQEDLRAAIDAVPKPEVKP